MRLAGSLDSGPVVMQVIMAIGISGRATALGEARKQKEKKGLGIVYDFHVHAPNSFLAPKVSATTQNSATTQTSRHSTHELGEDISYSKHYTCGIC